MILLTKSLTKQTDANGLAFKWNIILNNTSNKKCLLFVRSFVPLKINHFKQIQFGPIHWHFDKLNGNKCHSTINYVFPKLQYRLQCHKWWIPIVKNGFVAWMPEGCFHFEKHPVSVFCLLFSEQTDTYTVLCNSLWNSSQQGCETKNLQRIHSTTIICCLCSGSLPATKSQITTSWWKWSCTLCGNTGHKSDKRPNTV